MLNVPLMAFDILGRSHVHFAKTFPTRRPAGLGFPYLTYCDNAGVIKGINVELIEFFMINISAYK